MAIRTEPHVVADPDDWSDAVATTAGPQLVLAGPGTGKTEFLARRVAHLVETGHHPASLLVLTFSRRAASELERRILDLLDRPASGATASTFHGFAHRLLEAHLVPGGSDMPVLLTGPEQVRFASDLLAREDPGRWPLTFRPLLTSPTFAGEVADFVMRCHERLLGPDDLAALAEGRDDWRALPGFLSRYRSALEAASRIDYGTLLARAVELAEEGHADGFGHVVVDEYQDTSPAQARLAELAASEAHHITVAADPNQSIYSFRGAEVDNVADFPTRMEALTGSPAAIVLLTRSLRVPAAILASAGRLVADNAAPDLPSVPVEPAAHEGWVDVYTFDQRSAEAEWIAQEVERLHVSEGLPLSAMAVVVRSTRYLLPELSRALDRRSIAHDRPNTRLVDHPAVRIVHDAVICATAPPGSPESELAMRRLLLGPLVALPLGRERELVRRLRSSGQPWTDLIRQELPELEGLAQLLDTADWATGMAAVDGFWRFWDTVPGVPAIVADPARGDYRAAWSTLARMLDRQAERDPGVTLAEWLQAGTTGEFEASPLLSFVRPEDDRLVVTTLHQAKGLEFDVVFVADAIEGVFPDTRRSHTLLRPELLSPSRITDPAAQVDFRLAEERRLAYTATTRARRRVVWTATTAGIDEGERRPSRFLLAAAGVDTFGDVGPPPRPDDTEAFAPLTITDAEARLRRYLADPAASTVDRLASLRLLAQHSGHWSADSFAGVPRRGPDTGVIGPTLRLSPSQATSYDQCPRRYVIERRLRVIDVDSPYALFGSIIHEVLERAEKQAVQAGRPHADLDTALPHLDDVWKEDAAFGTPALNDVWYQRGVEFLGLLYQSWPGSDDIPVGLELELSDTIDGVEWIGRADRIERHDGGGVKVVDYKTSRSQPTLKEAAESLQLGFYVLAASRHPDLASQGPATAAELWYPAAKSVRKVFPFDMANLERIRSRLAEVARSIQAEDWAPRVGGHCERCLVKNTCPAWPDGREGYR